MKNQDKKFLDAFRRYIEDKYGYARCEMCGISTAFNYEVHHIVFRSEAPGHPALHSKDNLIFLCGLCHQRLHSKKSLRNELVEKRNLNEIFGRNLIINKQKHEATKSNYPKGKFPL